MQNNVSDIGLHIRVISSLDNVLEKAIKMKLPVFQCFLIPQSSKRHVHMTDAQKSLFAEKMRKNFKTAYLHASYWVNLAGARNNGWRVFQKEFALAQELGFTHLIIHPGSATGCTTRREGILHLARAINETLKKQSSLQLVLENTAHANLSVGGDLRDFRFLLECLDEPDRVFFCLDTAHAYSFGYDIAHEKEQLMFFEEVKKNIGQKRVVLIHLNDTKERCGSRIDRHAIPGKGNIGIKGLKSFLAHEVCENVPVIVELPVVTEREENLVLDTVRSWADGRGI